MPVCCLDFNNTQSCHALRPFLLFFSGIHHNCIQQAPTTNFSYKKGVKAPTAERKYFMCGGKSESNLIPKNRNFLFCWPMYVYRRRSVREGLATVESWIWGPQHRYVHSPHLGQSISHVLCLADNGSYWSTTRSSNTCSISEKPCSQSGLVI